MDFRRELGRHELFEEMKPLLLQHHAEVSHFPDLEPDPDWFAYIQMELSGVLRIFTARDGLGALTGYACFMVLPSPHFKTQVQAVADVLFVRPDVRGFGRDFIRWCERQLQTEDRATACFIHVNVQRDFGPMLKSLGYTLAEMNYLKRFDVEA